MTLPHPSGYSCWAALLGPFVFQEIMHCVLVNWLFSDGQDETTPPTCCNVSILPLLARKTFTDDRWKIFASEQDMGTWSEALAVLKDAEKHHLLLPCHSFPRGFPVHRLVCLTGVNRVVDKHVLLDTKKLTRLCRNTAFSVFAACGSRPPGNPGGLCLRFAVEAHRLPFELLFTFLSQ